jgi:hypothetical protein
VTDWLQIEVEGNERVLRAFVAGFCRGRGRPSAALYGRDCGVATELFSERVRELFAAGHHELLYAPAKLAGELHAALAESGNDLGLLASVPQRVKGARVEFSAEAFSSEAAAVIRRELLAGLPPGVTIARLEEALEHEPGEKGGELYAPVHGYAFRARGEYRGPLPGVIEMRRRATDLELVRTGSLLVETED